MTPNARYEKIIEAFGGKGYHCTQHRTRWRRRSRTPSQQKGSTLINVAIAPQAHAPQAAVRLAAALRQLGPGRAQLHDEVEGVA